MMDHHEAHAHHAHAATTGSDVEYVARLLSQTPSGYKTGNSGSQRKRHRELTAPPQLAAPRRQPESNPLVAQYKKPSNKSSSKQYFCEACSCSVGRRDQDWQTHVTGNRHQRQLVSLQHTGQLGNVLLSVFESAPGDSLASCCTLCCLTKCNRSRCELAETSKNTQPIANLTDEQLECFRCKDRQKLARLRTNALKVIQLTAISTELFSYDNVHHPPLSPGLVPAFPSGPCPSLPPLLVVCSGQLTWTWCCSTLSICQHTMQVL